MATFNLLHWLVVITALIILPALVIPFWRILPRAGLPAPMSLISIIPLGGIILLWIMAFKRWPEDK